MRFFPVLLLILFISAAAPLRPALSQQPEETKVLSQDEVKLLNDSIVDTGINRDDIPPVEKPVFIAPENAALVHDKKEHVFLARFGREVRIYPQMTLVWHQIVNDTVGDKKISITYCPLTGSVVGYYGDVDKFSTTFGDTGRLVNNNMLMYDRSTNSQWPQILGMAVDGPLAGKSLKTFPLVWTTFERAVAKYPKAKVLSRDTGHNRPYSRDPYGTYLHNKSYYHSKMVVFPLLNFDDRLHPKERILALSLVDLNAAVVKSSVKKSGAGNFDAGVLPLTVLYDAELDACRVFDRRVGRRTLHFVRREDSLFDVETNTRWSPEGEALAGPMLGRKLKQIPAFDCMWFAWAAFHPDSEIVSWKATPPPVPEDKK